MQSVFPLSYCSNFVDYTRFKLEQLKYWFIRILFGLFHLKVMFKTTYTKLKNLNFGPTCLNNSMICSYIYCTSKYSMENFYICRHKLKDKLSNYLSSESFDCKKSFINQLIMNWIQNNVLYSIGNTKYICICVIKVKKKYMLWLV